MVPRSWIEVYCNEGHEQEVLAALRSLMETLPPEVGFDFHSFDAVHEDEPGVAQGPSNKQRGKRIPAWSWRNMKPCILIPLRAF